MSDAEPESWTKFLEQALVEIANRGQLRSRSVGVDLSTIDFGSNDYLGLRDHPAMRSSLQHTLQHSGWGSGASPVLRGYSSMHATLERALSTHCQTAAALVFSSGYACNVGTLASLADAQTLVYSDELNHASLIDGIRLSKASRIIFPHLDLLFLSRHLQSHRAGYKRALIVSESVFSMDGDCADLAELCRIAEQFECGLIVDEAHATGVYGPSGAGRLAELPIRISSPDLFVLKLGTLSKALGGIGGFAAGSQPAIDYLVNRCRSYLFSTAPPAASLAASLTALELLRGMQFERQKLRQTSITLRSQLQAQGWNVPPGDSPIVPLIVGSETTATQLSQRLAGQGIFVPAIRPPTVAPGTSRLRISLSTRHTQADVDALLTELASVCR